MAAIKRKRPNSGGAQRRPPARERPQARVRPVRELAPRERPRRALEYTGGPTLVAGDPELAATLANALDTASEPRDRLTHGFHSYPARMHWATAARVLAALGVRGGHVVDPFCGSGTVLVEARAFGMSATGVDLNPLAVRLSRLKTEPGDAGFRAQLSAIASEVRELSEARVQARDPIRAELPRAEAVWYEGHVLKEMAGLFAEVQNLENARIREALTLVFSSLVVKFSRQQSDTAEKVVERRLRKGLVSEFFERKAHELSDRLRSLESVTVGPKPRIVESDARKLARIVKEPADLILTSPPYGGTYDYVAHHARRFAWLGIAPNDMARLEIGARRRGMDAERFHDELLAVLRACHDALKPGAMLVMLMGDAHLDGEDVPADDLVASLAEDANLEPVAVASQPRAGKPGSAPRAEHLMALRRL